MWDENKKQWVDKNADSDDVTSVIKPPPKASDLQTFSGNVNNPSLIRPDPTNFVSNAGPPVSMETSNQTFGAPGRNLPMPNVVPPASSNNIYKLQKGRGTC